MISIDRSALCQVSENCFQVVFQSVYSFPQEADLAQADKYAEVAMAADRYNPSGW